MTPKQNLTHIDKSSKGAKQELTVTEYHDPAYTKTLQDDKKYYRIKAENLQKELDKCKEEKHRIELNNRVLVSILQNFNNFQILIIIGSSILGIISALNVAIISKCGYVVYYSVCSVACTCILIYFILIFRQKNITKMTD
jgi:hypothetical protein